MVVKRSGSGDRQKVGQSTNVAYVVGYGRLPDGTSAKHMYGVFALAIEVERETGKILEVSSTAVPDHGNEVLRKILVGKKLEDDLDHINEEIRSRFVDRTRGAVLAALEDVVRRFKEHDKGS
jgi:beta-lactamase class A